MKRILITGANSYIGTCFENYMKKWNDKYFVDTVDMVDGSWRKKDFSEYDVVFHVAGLAHADVGRVSEEEKQKYYKVNTDLTIETAKKAKEDGVKQFIFMSSAIVYGESASVGNNKMITKDTETKPANFYGDSKLQAEIGIKELGDEVYRVAILRPPMIYGKGSKGNYPILAKLAKKLKIFPSVKNQRSMIYIENFLEFVKKVIDNEDSGVFFPQNSQYVSTVDMVKKISEVSGRKIIVTSLLNPFVWIASKIPGRIGQLVNKAFGNFTYDMELSNYDNYRIYNFKESIRKTEE